MQFEATMSIATKLYKYTARKQAEWATKKCARHGNLNYRFLRVFLAASIACLIARRFAVFLEWDFLFLMSCDALFAIIQTLYMFIAILHPFQKN